jgi:hypothetical protein
MNKTPCAIGGQLWDESILSGKCWSQLRLVLKTNVFVRTVILGRKRETNCRAASKNSSCLREMRVAPFQCIFRDFRSPIGTVCTNVTGLYDVSLRGRPMQLIVWEYAPVERQGPSWGTALRERLELRLEAQKVPVPFW